MKKILVIFILAISVNAHAVVLGWEAGVNVSASPSIYVGGSFLLLIGGLELGRDIDDEFTYLEPYLGLQFPSDFFTPYLEFGMPITTSDSGYSIDLGATYEGDGGSRIDWTFGTGFKHMNLDGKVKNTIYISLSLFHEYFSHV